MDNSEKTPVVLRIILKTWREMFRVRFAIILVLLPFTIWLATAVDFSVTSWYLEGKDPVLWNLDQIWKDELRERIRWVEEVGLHRFKMDPKRSEEQLTQYLFLSHASYLVRTHKDNILRVFPLTILLITTIFLDRFFRKGELTLYLVRPVDSAQLFWGRFLGLYTGFTFVLLMSMVLLLLGGFGPEKVRVLPLVMYEFQSMAAIMFAILAVPFLIAPLTGNLFRGAGTFVLSLTVLVSAYLLPHNKTVFKGLFPYRFIQSDPLSHKILVVFQDIFIIPIPRIFSAEEGLTSLTETFRNAWGMYELDSVVMDNAGYWWWTFMSGILVLMIASIIWIRRENG